MSESEKFNRLLKAFQSLGTKILPNGSRLALYGSRARGDFHKDSDWDLHILIPFEGKIRWDLWDLYAWPFSDIGNEYGEIVNPRLYSFKSWNKRNFLPFFKEVEKDKVILLQK